MINLYENLYDRTYRVKWHIEKPITLWEQSDIVLDSEAALSLFKEKIEVHSKVVLIEEKPLAIFKAIK